MALILYISSVLLIHVSTTPAQETKPGETSQGAAAGMQVRNASGLDQDYSSGLILVMFMRWTKPVLSIGWLVENKKVKCGAPVSGPFRVQGAQKDLKKYQWLLMGII